jgi:hypothetical protein
MPKSSQSDGEMLKGTLDMMILRTLVGGDAHGHTVAKIIEAARIYRGQARRQQGPLLRIQRTAEQQQLRNHQPENGKGILPQRRSSRQTHRD